nr:MAG TPA: hypothetical protein [Caudoviricetes sp.]
MTATLSLLTTRRFQSSPRSASGMRRTASASFCSRRRSLFFALAEGF